MRVIFPVYTYATNSGFGRLLWGLAKGLRNLNVKVTVAAVYLKDESAVADMFRHAGIEVVYAHSGDAGTHLNRLYQLMDPYIQKFAKDFKTLLRGVDADFYIFPNETSLPLATDPEFEGRFVHYYAGLWSGMALWAAWFNRASLPIKLGRLATLPNHYIYSKYLRAADHVLAVSHYAKDVASLLTGRLPEGVIYPPVDADFFKPLNTDDMGEPYAFFLGSKYGEVGMEIVEAVARRVRVVTGGGIQIQSADNRGYVTDEELRRLYSAATLTLFPIMDEPFGYAPVESMACATPPIAFDNGGPSETIVNDVTGFLASDGASFVKQSAALISVLSTRKASLGLKGRNRVITHFSIEASARRLIEYLNAWSRQ